MHWPVLTTTLPRAGAERVLAVVFAALGAASGCGGAPVPGEGAAVTNSATKPVTKPVSKPGGYETQARSLVVANSGLLSETGLYDDIASGTIAADVLEFKPAYALWTDGARKRRFIWLPPGAQIDTSNMDRWEFPVGTRFWKEFTRDGIKVETRYIERIGPEAGAYRMGAFLWDDDEREARYLPEGRPNAKGTSHDVPSEADCFHCHRGEPGRALGFSAVQLSKDPGDGPTLGEIAARGLLTAAPLPGTDYRVPGDAVTRAALGVLHANCGHCHNPFGSVNQALIDLGLRVSVTDGDPRETATYRTVVNVDMQEFRRPGLRKRIVPGEPEASAIYYRYSRRGEGEQMPLLGTKIVDDEGVAAVTAWINSLALPVPPPDPPPPPPPPPPDPPPPPPDPPPAPQPEPQPQTDPQPQPQPDPQPQPEPQPQPDPQPQADPQPQPEPQPQPQPDPQPQPQPEPQPQPQPDPQPQPQADPQPQPDPQPQADPQPADPQPQPEPPRQSRRIPRRRHLPVG